MFQVRTQQENNSLEARLKELETELRAARLQAETFRGGSPLASAEERYSEADAANFLQRNQLS